MHRPATEIRASPGEPRSVPVRTGTCLEDPPAGSEPSQRRSGCKSLQVRAVIRVGKIRLRVIATEILRPGGRMATKRHAGPRPMRRRFAQLRGMADGMHRAEGRILRLDQILQLL